MNDPEAGFKKSYLWNKTKYLPQTFFSACFLVIVNYYQKIIEANKLWPPYFLWRSKSEVIFLTLKRSFHKGQINIFQKTLYLEQDSVKIKSISFKKSYGHCRPQSFRYWRSITWDREVMTSSNLASKEMCKILSKSVPNP